MKSANSYRRFVDFDHVADPSKEVIASYYVRKSPGCRLEGAIFLGAIAAESSTGTWIEVSTDSAVRADVGGKVFEYDELSGIAKIAYPAKLFEPGNVSQLLTVVAGNALGLADVSALKLLDISLPTELSQAFPGPAIGMDGIYDLLQIDSIRPICGAILKPKCGLDAKTQAGFVKEAWTGLAYHGLSDGVDMVKDDEALTSQRGFDNDFYTRIRLCIDAMKAAEDITGNPKVFVPNVTHSNVYESLRRAEFVKKLGGNAVMVDYVIGGASLLHSLRCENLGLIIHGHRTLFAAMHRSQDFGVDYRVWAKLFRLIGGDQVHIGTPALGVMKADKSYVKHIYETVTEAGWRKAKPGIAGVLAQDFTGMKPVAPICGAGLDPTTTRELCRELGKELIMFAGGGVFGHPGGVKAGAAAFKQSALAAGENQTLSGWAINREDLYFLQQAMGFFGSFDKQSPNDKAREAL